MKVALGGLERAVSKLKSGPAKASGDGMSFDRVLRQVARESPPLKLSAHAEMRLKQRGIVLSPEELGKLSEAVERVREKGAKESLLLMREMAFLVNVRNRTVITALDRESMRERVFTNIDSAVII